MAYYFMKMLLVQCLYHYDIVSANGNKKIKLPSECPRSSTTTLINEDIEVILVKRTKDRPGAAA